MSSYFSYSSYYSSYYSCLYFKNICVSPILRGDIYLQVLLSSPFDHSEPIPYSLGYFYVLMMSITERLLHLLLSLTSLDRILLGKYEVISRYVCSYSSYCSSLLPTLSLSNIFSLGI